VREVLEETAHVFTPSALLGVYYGRFQRPASEAWPQGEDISYMRFAFCGAVGEAIAERSLDMGIVRTLWMTPDEVRATRERHRSAYVLACMEDYLRGQRYPLELVRTDASVYRPPA
jgi:hypothetical protein